VAYCGAPGWSPFSTPIPAFFLAAGNTPLPDPLTLAVEAIYRESKKLIVFSAGNEGPAPRTISCPGAKAFTAGAINKLKKVAEFSSRGPLRDGTAKPDIVAPGAGVEILDHNGDTRFVDGTSFSAPLVSAAAALLKQADSSLAAVQIYGLLREGAISNGNGKFAEGAGCINIYRSLQLRHSFVRQSLIRSGSFLFPLFQGFKEATVCLLALGFIYFGVLDHAASLPDLMQTKLLLLGRVVKVESGAYLLDDGTAICRIEAVTTPSAGRILLVKAVNEAGELREIIRYSNFVTN